MQYLIPHLFLISVFITANLKFISCEIYTIQIKDADRINNFGRENTYDYGFADLPNFKPKKVKHTAHGFSHDYVDVNDLGKEGKYSNLQLLSKIKEYRQPLKMQEYDLLNLLVGRRMLPVQRKGKKKDSSESESDNSESLEGNNNSSDKEDEQEEDDDDEEVPKRFQVINNSDETKEVSGSETEEYTPVQFNKIKNKNVDKYLYMQGLTRLVKAADLDRRRRLQHFLPKRVHWDEKEYKDLINYWISGPQGRFTEQ